MSAPIPAPIAARDPWAPFRHRVYLVIWTATVVSNVGSWMYNAAAAWLMTSLSADPMMVSLVQVASNLPIFLFALPAGAIADVVDRRRFLLIAETSYAVVAVVFAALVAWNLVTPAILLAFVFVLDAGTAVMAPPYQSIVPLLVPRHDLAPAVAANSVGMNISRAVGPALGGIITAVAGIAAPFWVNALVSQAIGDDAGPVMVTIEYEVEPRERDAFLEAINLQAAERRRDGAYWWGVFEDVEKPGSFVETFHVESWLEHKRQHGRVTRADRDVEQRVRRFAHGEPHVRHMIAAAPGAAPKIDTE